MRVVVSGNNGYLLFFFSQVNGNEFTGLTVERIFKNSDLPARGLPEAIARVEHYRRLTGCLVLYLPGYHVAVHLTGMIMCRRALARGKDDFIYTYILYRNSRQDLLQEGFAADTRRAGLRCCI